MGWGIQNVEGPWKWREGGVVWDMKVGAVQTETVRKTPRRTENGRCSRCNSRRVRPRKSGG